MIRQRLEYDEWVTQWVLPWNWRELVRSVYVIGPRNAETIAALDRLDATLSEDTAAVREAHRIPLDQWVAGFDE